MKFRIYFTLARGVVLESVRRKDLWVVAILGLVVLATASTIGFFGSSGLEVFIKDLSATVLGLFATVVATVVSCRVIPDEVKNRTLYPLLARPISRLDFIIGKWLGAVLVTWIGFALLLITTSIALAGFHVPFEWIMLQYVFLKLLGLALICSIGICLSTLLTPPAAVTLTFISTYGVAMVSRGLSLGYAHASPLGQWTSKAISALLPQTQLFDISGRAVYVGWQLVPLWVVGALTLYCIVYSGAMLTMSFLRMQKKAL